MVKGLASFLGRVLVLVLIAEAALACRCLNTESRAWALVMEQYPVIFAGRWIDRELAPPQWSMIDGEPEQVRSSADPVRYRFEVHASWQGDPGSHLDVISAVSSVSCGYRFEPGRDYLVFARRDQEDELVVSLCSPTRPLELALRHRDLLGSPARVEQPLPPLPGPETIDALLTDSDSARVQSAIEYWRDLDCGIELLFWRMEALPISDSSKSRLMSRIRAAVRYTEPLFVRPDRDLRRLLPPPERPGFVVPPRNCSEPTQRWVKARIESILEP